MVRSYNLRFVDPGLEPLPIQIIKGEAYHNLTKKIHLHYQLLC